MAVKTELPILDATLRAKKHARTKVALAMAFIEKLKDFRFEDISIREICRDVELSEGTFFNYFDEKIDVVNYYLNLVDLKIIWKARRKGQGADRLALIDRAFAGLVEMVISPNLVSEIITAMVRQKESPQKIAISPMEKRYAFEDCPGIENEPTMRLEDFFRSAIEGAVKNGELPGRQDVEDVVVSLKTILVGTLLAARRDKTNRDLNYHYRRQLAILWKGLGRKGL
jgi:AcrR family transcriptional regulator